MRQWCKGAEPLKPSFFGLCLIQRITNFAAHLLLPLGFTQWQQVIINLMGYCHVNKKDSAKYRKYKNNRSTPNSGTRA
jgi:hypothetical protein